MTADMEPPRLPSVYVDAGGLRVNMMDGYLGEMEEEYMRGRLLPIGADRKISIGILTYGTQVDALAFEVRSADGTRLVEDTQVSAITEEDGVLKADIVLKDRAAVERLRPLKRL